MILGIFISYRRDDSAGQSGRLFDDLEKYFGAKRVFRDVSDSIPTGADFGEEIRKALRECKVMLAVIGRRWSTLDDGHGNRRLDLPDDWVRAEIGEALGRKDVKVIPVRVDGAGALIERELPEDLRELARRQDIELSEGRWKQDVRRLMRALPASYRLRYLLGRTGVGRWLAIGGAFLVALYLLWTSACPVAVAP